MALCSYKMQPANLSRLIFVFTTIKIELYRSIRILQFKISICFFNDCICAVSGHIWTFKTDFDTVEFHLRLLNTDTFIWCCETDDSVAMFQHTGVRNDWHHTLRLSYEKDKTKKLHNEYSWFRFILPLTESNVSYALFARAGLWFIGTSVTYEVFRCLHDPFLANLCFRVKIQKWASITSAAGSIKTRGLVKSRFLQ